MKCWLFAALLALGLGQQKPDFSGTWKQDNARCDFGTLPAPISVVDVINHKDPDLHLTETVVGPQGDSITSEHDFFTDGRENSGRSSNYTEKNSVKWDGNSLVFVYTRNSGEREAVIRERWTLSDDGKSIRKDRSLQGRKGEVRQVFVLDKQ